MRLHEEGDCVFVCTHSRTMRKTAVNAAYVRAVPLHSVPFADSCPVSCIHWVEKADLAALEYVMQVRIIVWHMVVNVSRAQVGTAAWASRGVLGPTVH